MDEFRWSDLQEEAKESLDELLANVRSDLARENLAYPGNSRDKDQFEMNQLERADEWVQLGWQTYCDTLARIGREVSDLPPIIWSTGILGFIDQRIEPLLEAAFGITDKDREFLKRGGIAAGARLKQIGEHPLDRSTPWLKLEAVQLVTRYLKGQWKTRLSGLGECKATSHDPFPVVNGALGGRLIGSPLPSSALESILEGTRETERSFQRTLDMMWELRSAQREEDRKKRALYYRDLELSRELEHAREMAKIQRASVESKTSHAENDPLQAASGTRRKGKRDYKSSWKRAIRQALLVLDDGAPYQRIANWIAENVPDLDLPGYCTRVLKTGERGDMGLLYRTNKAVREQFSKDVAKIKTDLKS